MDRYRDDPAGFNTDVLRRSAYWARQEEICRSIVDYYVTVVYSGNAIGKDYLLGGIVPWWVFTRRDALCVVTGVSQTLLGSVTWKEVRRAIEGSPLLRALKPKMSNGVRSSPQLLEIRPGWHALGYSTSTVERASGQHAPELLALMNEASGIDDDIYDAIDSLKYKRLAIFGNPIRAEGRFVDLIRQAEADARDGVPKHLAVNAIRIPSTDSPHADEDSSPWGLADKTWLQSMYRRYGRDSLWVKSHIEAIIPSVSADTLIPESWLDYAATIPRDPATLAPEHPAVKTRKIRCDLGEGVGRDSSAIIVGDDWGILEVAFGSAMGPPEAADRIYNLAVKWKVPHERIGYDRAGIGRKFPLHLARYGITAAQGYTGAGKPECDEFTNLRSEAGWRLHQRLDPQGTGDYRRPWMARVPYSIPPGDYWPRLREELSKLSYHAVGKRTAILSKEDHAEMLGHSPDLADAMLQTFAF